MGNLVVERSVVERADAFDKLEQWLHSGGKVSFLFKAGRVQMFTVPTQHVDGCCLMDVVEQGKHRIY